MWTVPRKLPVDAQASKPGESLAGLALVVIAAVGPLAEPLDGGPGCLPRAPLAKILGRLRSQQLLSASGPALVASRPPLLLCLLLGRLSLAVLDRRPSTRLLRHPLPLAPPL